MNPDELVGFLESNWFALVFWSLASLLVFRLVRPVVDRIGERIIRTREAQGIDPAELNELRKRLSTIEDLVSKLLRAAVIFVILVVLLTLLDLVSVVVALGVVFAGLAIAGQSIVLDYLMGILILVEGQFYVGDWITIATGNVTVSGTVEEIGLRRTILRDVSGTVHSVSNGEVRVSSNMTRVYAVLQVEIPLIPEVDLEQAIAVTNRVGAEMYADPEWSSRLLEAPRYGSIPNVTDLGVTLRAIGRVQGADRFAAASELRRRLLVAYAGDSIAVAQRIRPPAP
ncbi:MAG TPA: mechanosensitive ion channel family protein [Candidatus Limnocylindria bacterium]|jgi:small conductance mechanosensitive channel|nr:mechanosensitive ion channel family protein [Candidatus Limnocylindria bacterium]